MALALCEEHGADRARHYERPATHFSPGPSRRRWLGEAYEPEGYPNSALVCCKCTSPALIWLGNAERRAYREGVRIFAFAGVSGRVRLR